MAEIKITKDMMIGDIVNEHPKAAHIMLGFGLHCIGCHISPHETLEAGCQGHGMPEEIMNKMLDEINTTLNKKIETIEVTKNAAEMIKAFQKEDGKEGQGLKISAQNGCCGLNYEMEFVEKPAEGDQTFEFDGLKVYMDSESFTLMKGSEIDFIDGLQESGFRIDNPNTKQKDGCCGGDAGCGCHDDHDKHDHGHDDHDHDHEHHNGCGCH